MKARATGISNIGKVKLAEAVSAQTGCLEDLYVLSAYIVYGARPSVRLSAGVVCTAAGAIFLQFSAIDGAGSVYDVAGLSRALHYM